MPFSTMLLGLCYGFPEGADGSFSFPGFPRQPQPRSPRVVRRGHRHPKAGKYRFLSTGRQYRPPTLGEWEKSPWPCCELGAMVGLHPSPDDLAPLHVGLPGRGKSLTRRLWRCGLKCWGLSSETALVGHAFTPGPLLKAYPSAFRAASSLSTIKRAGAWSPTSFSR